ncbi:hypothetical protein BC332_12856 [Capsicum chinense]|nr:hypothetical protein BC332_12856 [Capsicum chinense]
MNFHCDVSSYSSETSEVSSSANNFEVHQEVAYVTDCRTIIDQDSDESDTEIFRVKRRPRAEHRNVHDSMSINIGKQCFIFGYDFLLSLLFQLWRNMGLYGGPKDGYYIFSCSSEPDQEATQVIFWLDFWPRDMNKKLDVKKQQISLNSLSDTKSDVKVLLASIKASSDGISLIGASRVVLLDVFWNPAVEQQAVSGAYRNG